MLALFLQSDVGGQEGRIQDRAVVSGPEYGGTVRPAGSRYHRLPLMTVFTSEHITK